VATQPGGPGPTIRRCADGDAELDLVVATIRRLLREGVPPAEIAVLVRINAQVPPLEAALTKAALPFRVRGQRFFERQEVRDALRLLRRLPPTLRGLEVADALEARLRADLGFDPGGDVIGAEARERMAALALVLEIARDAAASAPGATTAAGAGAVAPGADARLDVRAVLAVLDARALAEAEGSADGVNLLTLHRAKGLEWDAVLLPGLEEGTLPIRQAAEDDEALAEERRLLYVGLTRARRHLALSWAERRLGSGDRESRRRPSRFLRALEATRAGATGTATSPGSHRSRALRVTVLPGAPMQSAPPGGRPGDEELMAELRAWRSQRAREDAVPAYVVAHDALLVALVEDRPGSPAALRRVRGMGPAKLDRYGAEILAILARH
jgi:DNA helicase II / ATP-dependent DNA helicase PcrA